MQAHSGTWGDRGQSLHPTKKISAGPSRYCLFVALVHSSSTPNFAVTANRGLRLNLKDLFFMVAE